MADPKWLIVAVLGLVSFLLLAVSVPMAVLLLASTAYVSYRFTKHDKQKTLK